MTSTASSAVPMSRSSSVPTTSPTPAARNDPSSPIHGMPILNVDEARSVIVLKRSMSSGYAGIENPLFFADGTSMLFGDAKKSVDSVIEELKAL